MDDFDWEENERKAYGNAAEQQGEQTRKIEHGISLGGHQTVRATITDPTDFWCDRAIN